MRRIEGYGWSVAWFSCGTQIGPSERGRVLRLRGGTGVRADRVHQPQQDKEHGMHARLMTMRLVDLLAVDSETATQTYYPCLLMDSGCTTDAGRVAFWKRG